MYLEATTSEEIHRAVEEAIAGAADGLVTVGGDGTVSGVLTSLYALRGAPAADTQQPAHAQASGAPWPLLGVVPAGMTNMTAHDLGVRSPPLRVMDRLAGWVAGRGVPPGRVRRAVLRVQGEGEPAVLGMFFGMGMVPDGVRFFQERLRRMRMAGEHNSGIAIVRTLLSLALRGGRDRFPSVALEAWWNDAPPLRMEALAGIASTLSRMVLGSRPFWGREEGPLHFSLVEREAATFWRGVPRFALGRPGRHMTPEGGWHSHNAARLVLRFQGPYVVDGELHTVDEKASPLVLDAPVSPVWLVP